LPQAAATDGNSQPPVSDHPSPANSIPASSNGKNLMPNQNDSSTVSEKIISNNEEINELHGDWMLVTRRKKSQPGPTHPSKNVTNKINRFTSLSHLVHQVKPIQVTNKNIPKPKSNEAPRVKKNHMETKRR